MLIVNEGKRNGWMRGRISSVIPGKDGRIRQAVVKTTEGMLRRPVSKLAVLQVQGEPKTTSVVAQEERYGSGNVANPGSTARKRFHETAYEPQQNCHEIRERGERKTSSSVDQN